jgi:hypothetical protein
MRHDDNKLRVGALRYAPANTQSLLPSSMPLISHINGVRVYKIVYFVYKIKPTIRYLGRIMIM